ncbi:hypothetical protein [Enterococcus mundtii]
MKMKKIFLGLTTVLAGTVLLAGCGNQSTSGDSGSDDGKTKITFFGGT